MAMAGSQLPFEELEVIDAESSHRLVWVGYQIAGRVTTSRLMAKALQLLGVLEGRRDAQALVLTTSCDESGCDGARASLARFASIGAEALYKLAAAEPRL